MQYKLLMIENDERVIYGTTRLLESRGYFLDVGISSDEGLNLLQKSPEQYAVLIMDYNMPGIGGRELIEKAHCINPELFILVYSGDETQDAATVSFKSGAIDFVQKGNGAEYFLNAVKICCHKYEETVRSVGLAKPETLNEKQIALVGMTGRSQVLADISRRIIRYGNTDDNALICGENGSGKELIARAIVQNSSRASGPYLTVNCASLNDNLLESELFGHLRGSFTGAVKDKKGLFEAADKGTIFLDEIGDTSTQMQAKLLRVLQDGTFTPVGSTVAKKVNVRVIAATNRDLVQMCKEKTFREDLFYRLKVLFLEVPPLRERPEDVEPLVAHFCDKKCREKGIKKKFLARTVRYMEKYNWPGNIRELENLVYSLIAETGDLEKIEPQHLPNIFWDQSQDNTRDMTYADFTKRLEASERDYVLNILRTSRSQTETAQRMSVPTSSLHYILKRLGLYKSVSV